MSGPMRPRPITLPPGARLHAPAPVRLPRPFRGARQYVRTTEIANSATVRFSTSRPTVAYITSINRCNEQQRCITQQHMRRMKEAEDEWEELAVQIRNGEKRSFLEHLEERGLVKEVVGERDLLHRIFTEKRVGLYAGVDPTAPSLHVGHMLPFMVLAWGYVWGLPVTFLLGGSTSRVGDPTGRIKGREQVHSSIRKANMASMHMQLLKLGQSINEYGKVHGYRRKWAWRRALVNNNTWWNKQPFFEVLRDLGLYMRLGPMLGRDTVKTRLSSGDGMSFAEFCYPLLQAWDWWRLFRKGVQVQVGGSDQYGNILFGMDAVKSISRNSVMQEERNDLSNELDRPMGITTPLLTTPSGEKFGKSAGNAIWLDKDMTSTFELYQFFVRTPDDVVEKYLKMFTFLPIKEISEIMQEQNKDPSKRVAQHTLAYEFTHLIHGRHEAEAVSAQHRHLFRPRDSTAEPTPLRIPRPADTRTPRPSVASFINPQAGNPFAPHTTFANMPSARVTLPQSLVYNQPFPKILWSAGMVASKGEGHRIIVNKGAYVGSRPGIQKSMVGGDMPDQLTFTPIKSWEVTKTREFIDNDLLFLKLGKWKLKIVNIVPDEEFKALGLEAPGWDPGVVEGTATEIIEGAEKLDVVESETTEEPRQSETAEGPKSSE
ncbi:hypothetical protein BJY01DRAFT_54766 [Aspergillus pseudoustus]|uniref:Tyrosine--tRNA ligase n=1 Tax=Aspergillus pseudoustus TaxID=1810923 RepID=A0ABR4J928_9EURO